MWLLDRMAIDFTCARPTRPIGGRRGAGMPEGGSDRLSDGARGPCVPMLQCARVQMASGRWKQGEACEARWESGCPPDFRTLGPTTPSCTSVDSCIIRASTRCAGTCTRAGPPRAHAHAPSAPLGVLRRRLEESRVWARFARPVLLPCRFARPPPHLYAIPRRRPKPPHPSPPPPHSIHTAATPPTSPRYSSGVCVVPQA